MARPRKNASVEDQLRAQRDSLANTINTAAQRIEKLRDEAARIELSIKPLQDTLSGIDAAIAAMAPAATEKAKASPRKSRKDNTDTGETLAMQA